jgi:hypothetical protein
MNVGSRHGKLGRRQQRGRTGRKKARLANHGFLPDFETGLDLEPEPGPVSMPIPVINHIIHIIVIFVNVVSVQIPIASQNDAAPLSARKVFFEDHFA